MIFRASWASRKPPPSGSRPRKAASSPRLAVAAGCRARCHGHGPRLNFAAALRPAGKVGRVVLLSDGNDTADGGVQAASRLAASGSRWIRCRCAIHSSRRCWWPASTCRPASNPASHSTPAPTSKATFRPPTKVNLYQNQFLVSQQDVPVRPGRNDILFPNLRAGDGFTAYEVEILPVLDTRLGKQRGRGNRRAHGTSAGAARRFQRRARRPLAGALRDAQIDVEVRGPAGLPRTLSELQRFDLFMAERCLGLEHDARSDGAVPDMGSSSSVAASS